MCLNCHVITIDLEINDAEALKTTCEKLGWKLHQRPHKWYGRWVDDSPVPKIFEPDEQARVEGLPKHKRQEFLTKLFNQTSYAIEVPGQPYEIGLLNVMGKWKILWDFWRGELDFNPFKQQYAAQTTINQAKSQGHIYEETTLEDGTIKLTMHVGDYQ
jgi:hypothetical protein